MKTQLNDLAAALFFLALIALLMTQGLSVAAPKPAPPAPPQVVMGKYDPLAVYRERDRTLIVTKQAGRDLLVCLGDERDDHCKLVEEWLHR